MVSDEGREEGRSRGGAGRTIGGEEEVGVVLPLAPLDLVDLFLDFHALEVVKLGLVALKFRPKFVLAALFLIPETMLRKSE